MSVRTKLYTSGNLSLCADLYDSLIILINHRGAQRRHPSTCSGQAERGKLFAVVVLACLFFINPFSCSELYAEEGQHRQRPGTVEPASDFDPGLPQDEPDIRELERDFVPVTTLERWRLLDTNPGYDPYNTNILKGDIPIRGSGNHLDFFEFGIISDTLFENRLNPTPVGISSTSRPGSNNTLGNYKQNFFNQTIIPSFVFIRGNTAFKPPEVEFRIIPALNFNHVSLKEDVPRVDPSRGRTRTDSHLGFIELFGDLHLHNFGKRYDFISIRAGIQSFNADFRGLLYIDDAPGIRLFGNLDNNKWQYNLAWFSRLDKDVNSGLNTTFRSRGEEVYIANLYRQDLLTLGHNMQILYAYRDDSAGGDRFRYDDNGFLVRPASIGTENPKNVRTSYLGFNTDGKINRINISSSYYFAFGEETHNPIAGRQVDIRAHMAALELSYDWNWLRFRTSAFYASGDKDPFDGRATGFDSIFDNPNFLGGDNGFWQRQGIPFIGGGGVPLVNRLSLLPNLRATKELGQSNFVNPGLRAVHLGLDADVLPQLRLIGNVSYLQFDETAVIETLRQDGSIKRDIGTDLSLSVLYRPLMTENIQFRAGASTLLPQQAMKNLYGDKQLYTLFTNLILIF